MANANKIAAIHVSVVCEDTLGKAMYFSLRKKFSKVQHPSLLHAYANSKSVDLSSIRLASLHNNIHCIFERERRLVVLRSLREIQEGEELFSTYFTVNT